MSFKDYTNLLKYFMRIERFGLFNAARAIEASTNALEVLNLSDCAPFIREFK